MAQKNTKQPVQTKVVLSTDEEKKKALAIAIVMEMLINVFICVSQTLLHGNSNFVQAVYEYTVVNNRTEH